MNSLCFRRFHCCFDVMFLSFWVVEFNHRCSFKSDRAFISLFSGRTVDRAGTGHSTRSRRVLTLSQNPTKRFHSHLSRSVFPFPRTKVHWGTQSACIKGLFKMLAKRLQFTSCYHSRPCFASPSESTPCKYPKQKKFAESSRNWPKSPSKHHITNNSEIYGGAIGVSNIGIWQ